MCSVGDGVALIFAIVLTVHVYALMEISSFPGAAVIFELGLILYFGLSDAKALDIGNAIAATKETAINFFKV